MKEKELKVIQKTKEEYEKEVKKNIGAYFFIAMLLTVLVNFIVDLWNFSETTVDYIINSFIFLGLWFIIGVGIAIFFTRRIKLVEKKWIKVKK